MSGKSKFQISKVLDERIKRIVASSVDDAVDPELENVTSAYILGFHCGNATNYVGLTRDYKLFHAGLQVVGIAFFKSLPGENEIAADLEQVQKFAQSADGLGLGFKQDKNENTFLIYSPDEDSKQVDKKIFDLSSKSYVQEQPKLSVLEEPKIYNHSSLAKLTICIKLLKESDDTIEEAKKILTRDSKSIKLSLEKSNFCTTVAASEANKNLTESLYDHLEAPDDLEQMGDYLPQMTKKDKEKLLEKWRNKVKSQRAPLALAIQIDDDISLDPKSDSCPSDCYKLDLESFVYLHMNDPISKSMKVLLFSLRNRINLLQRHLERAEDLAKSLAAKEVKPCTFKPSGVGHLIPLMYSIPGAGVQTSEDYNRLFDFRKLVHSTYLLPMTQPLVRYSQRIQNENLTNEPEAAGFLCNVHASITENSGIKGGTRNIVQGTYTYHHYMQHRASDSGWGCAYRSLQTIISWFICQGYIYSPDALAIQASGKTDKTSPLRAKLQLERRVPTHEEIQSVLVDVGDKQPSFIGSQKWIGSQEVCYVLNHLYNIDSKFISVSSGSELVYKARDLGQHFASQRTPVMIGGGVLAHTIIGVDFNEKNGDISYLILDPHYTGGEDLAVIIKKGWCGWKKNSFWDKSAFYNLCLPQAPKEI